MRILALESSTASAKAMYYDTETKESQVYTESYEAMYADGTLHDTKVVFEKTAAAGRKVLQGRGADVVSLCSTWHSIGLFDDDLEPVTPMYPWSYTGASEICRELRKNAAFAERYYRTTGCMVNATYPFFKLLYLKEQGFDLAKYRPMGQGVYNTFRLTGRRVATRCMASGSGLLDICRKTYASEFLKAAGIPEDRLPELIGAERMYPLTEDGAKALGIKAGTPVIPANADGGLNQIGVGALKKGVMTFSVGTSGAIRLTAEKAVTPSHPSTWCYLSPKSYLSGAAVAGCCSCIDWFRNQVGNGWSYAQLEAKAAEAADTPVFLPFLFGERCPGWNDERTGGFCRLKPEHGIGAMYRSVQEGVLFNLYHCYQLLTEVNEEPQRIRLSGGILHSEMWTQMCADIFNREMEVDEVQQGSLMGAVVLAMDLMGIVKAENFTAAPGRILRPDPKNAEIYRKKFQRYLSYYRMEA